MDAKDLINALDLPEGALESVEKFKENFSGKFISRELVSEDKELVDQIFGKRVGNIETKTKQLFKTFGVEFSSEEIKDLKVEDLLKLGKERLSETFDSKLEEVKSNYTGQEKETIDRLNADLEALKGQLTEKETLVHQANKKVEETEAEFNNRMNDWKVKNSINEAKGKIPFKANLTELEKAGYEATISSKYDFKLEEDKIFVFDKEGKKINNEKGTSFATPEEILIAEAKAFKLTAENNGSSDTRLKTSISATAPEGQTRAVHPRAMARVSSAE